MRSPQTYGWFPKGNQYLAMRFPRNRFLRYLT